MIIQYLCLFILKYILGWKIEKPIDKPDIYSNKHNVIIYNHTSTYDLIIGYLISRAYNIPLINTAHGDPDIPYFDRFLINNGFIIIDRKKDHNTVKYISDRLNEKERFNFSISPLSLDNIKPGFFNIAMETKSDLWIGQFDFEKQLFRLKNINTTEYDKLIHVIEKEIREEKPYNPYKCYITENKSYKSSIINISRSIIIYIPPIIVMMILLNTFIHITI
jgi:hypothetical protein